MVKDEAATLGFVSYLTKPVATSNSVMVDILLDAGAVLYCKTNVPQTLFVCGGMNNVFGYTLNPHKLCLTPSGSSSGEGALVGFRGSILGVGTDIGGSIRAPSLCCGTFGFKPTANRLPYGGQQELIRKGWPGVVPALGPLAQSPQDLTYFVRSIIETEPWRRDESALYAPWREIPQKSTLKIGLWAGDAEFPLHPPMQRALNGAAAALEAAGHQIKRIQTPIQLRRAAEIFALSSRLDTKNSIFQFLADGDEEPIPALIEIFQGISTRNKESSADDIWEFNSQRSDYRSVWHWTWMESDIDVLLCPPSRTTAVPHGKYGVPWYTMIWNLLDCPAAVIPFLHADKTLDAQEMDGLYK
ncbi:amidase [Fusarium albosuccineum]|uniref:Amidase n=1 Tax=Fusarium albosuccineum TaxID=1237068 RepID=A0A8H4KY49_9HYPO|nr:amidase [Fusarium albosuccineum]